MVTRYSQEELTCTLDIISNNSSQTQRLGMRLGELLSGGELILLNGRCGPAMRPLDFAVHLIVHLVRSLAAEERCH